MGNVAEYQEFELSNHQIKSIVSLVNTCWPNEAVSLRELIADNLRQRKENAQTMIDNRTMHFVIWETKKAIAHSRTFKRAIFTHSGALEVMALAGVCVQPEQRGKGYGKAVVEKAFEQVHNRVYGVSLFQTDDPLFYKKLGCRVINNVFYNSQNTADPTANPFWGTHVMIFPSSYAWPPGKIDLNGLGF